MGTRSAILAIYSLIPFVRALGSAVPNCSRFLIPYFYEKIHDFRKGSAVPKMGKEETDLLAMVDKLMQGEFLFPSNNVMHIGPEMGRKGDNACLATASGNLVEMT